MSYSECWGSGHSGHVWTKSVVQISGAVEKEQAGDQGKKGNQTKGDCGAAQLQANLRLSVQDLTYQGRSRNIVIQTAATGEN